MRHCIFCEKEIPENAIFCPSCGAKLPEYKEETKNEIEDNIDDEEDIDEQDNIALAILSKAVFSSSPTRKESIIPPPVEKKPQRKITKVIPEEKKEQKVEDIENEFIIHDYNKTKKESQIEQAETEETEELGIIIKEYIEESEPEYDEETKMLFAKLEEMTQQPNDYIPPMLNDIKEQLEETDISSDIPPKEPEKKQEKEQEKEQETPEAIRPNKEEKNILRNTKNKNIQKVTYSKRNLSAEDESDDEIVFNSSLRKDSALNYKNINDDLTEDEKADIEKYKKYEEIEGKKEETSRKKGEGRKSNGRKKEARKNVDKTIAQRKINVIEHEEVKKNEDVDDDYDGYYENVLPIDYDKQRDNSAIIKTVLTALVFIALASAIFYLLISFFMK